MSSYARIQKEAFQPTVSSIQRPVFVLWESLTFLKFVSIFFLLRKKIKKHDTFNLLHSSIEKQHGFFPSVSMVDLVMNPWGRSTL